MKTLKSKVQDLKALFLLSLLIGLTSVSFAAEEIWTIKADMPTARMFFGTCVVEGKIYAIGGQSPAGTFSTVEEYDPVTDTWATKAEMPTARCGLSTSVVDGKIYAIGGVTYWDQTGRAPLATVEQYDPSTDTWTKKADIPTARSWLSTSVVGGKIYAIGGSQAGFNVLSTVQEYDPVSDTWKSKARMPTARDGLSTSVVDGKIYAIGGYGGYFAVEQYDPVTDIWTRKTSIPTGRCDLRTSVLDGKIYAIGGIKEDFEVLSVVEEYDPLTDTWMKKSDMPNARWGLSTSVFLGKIYAIGGGTGRWPSSVSVSTVYEYAPNVLIIDFNGDGIVDIKDLLRLIESWGQADPMCDIAPHPSGDGVVDALDLELLMSYWEQPIDDPFLLSHWTFDETEGTIAYDIAGISDAYLMGDPVWQPDTGKVGGALMFDGVNDYAFTPVALSPADGPFSVFAWIKGGATGQVIFSQSNGANWLMADSDLGCLMTELMPPAVGRSRPQPLKSESVITDDQWHRVGFVWDGINRTLYVDDILVAEDKQANLQGSDSGLYIGTGKAVESGTYWSGLIDDVRISNRAVRP
jgi:N-acetylneuraminic acid mutarotase